MSRTGWRTEDIMQLGYNDLLHLDVSQLRKATQRISDYANKRIAKLEKTGTAQYSEAYKALDYGAKKYGSKKGRFGVRGISKGTPKQQRIDYIREIMRAQTFIKSPSSKPEGAKKLAEWFETKFGTVTNQEYDEVWELVDWMRSKTDYGNYTKSDRYIQIAVDVIKSRSDPSWEMDMMSKRYADALEEEYHETRSHSEIKKLDDELWALIREKTGRNK